MTFLELAEVILNESATPLTINEMWQLAESKGLHTQLKSSGKTPWATLGAQVHVNLRDNADTPFAAVGKRPKRFYLKGKKYDVDFSEYEEGKPEEEIVSPKVTKPGKTLLEKDLHPFLAHFAHFHLRCHCKTINHSKSTKKSFGEWVHPDMVGCNFPIEEWDNEVLGLSAATGNNAVKFISFELKRKLDLASLRENFFQTVSNSSWANESYLVAAEISNNEDFLNELGRLSSSFGVGVIELNLEDPHASSIRFAAQTRAHLDWETMNKLTDMNKDFKQFVKRVRIDLSSNEIRKEQYDKILSEEQLQKSIR